MVDELEVWPMFNVKASVEGKEVQRKTSDNIGILQWMEMKEATASVMKADLDKLNGKSIDYLKARALEEAWVQMKLIMQDSLGLLEKEPEAPAPQQEQPQQAPAQPEVEVRERPEPEPAPMNQPVGTEVPPAQPEAAPGPDTDFFEKPEEKPEEKDKEVVL